MIYGVCVGVWVCRDVGTLIRICAGAKGSIDEAFVQQYVRHVFDFGPYSLNVRGPGPP